MFHTKLGRIYRIDYMPRIEEMMDIIDQYRKISPEFDRALKEELNQWI